MINSQHAQLLREAVALCDKNKIDSAFQQVLREEIGGLKVGNEVQNHLKKIISNLAMPYEMEVDIQPVNLPVANEQQPMIWAKVLKLVGCLVMLVAISLLSVYWDIKAGIGVAALLTMIYALYLFSKKTGTDSSQHTSVNFPVPQVSVKPKIDAETLIQTANRIVAEMTYCADELNSPAPTQLPLHKCYLKILVWLQMVYGDSLDFDEDAKKYILKRVSNIAWEFDYEVRAYDGSNQNLFEVVESESVSEPQMYLPAIVHMKTNKVILPGRLFVPEKMNTD